jgi:cell division protein FtsL
MNHWLIRPAFWLGLMLVLATLITALFTVYTAYQTRQLYSALQETRAERDRLTIEWGRLLLERGAVSADMRIDAMARHQMALQPPEKERVVLMERPQ